MLRKQSHMQKMATKYKQVYKKDGRTIYAREHKSGKDSTTWEIRRTKMGLISLFAVKH